MAELNPAIITLRKKLKEDLEKLFLSKDSFYFQFEGTKKSNNVDRVQLIASLSKPMISFFFLSEILSNEITLQTPVSKFLETDLDINLEMLLKHRSGVFDYLNLTEEKINSCDLKTISKIILENTTAEMIKKSDYQYSNSGYVLLSQIIEVVYENSYEKALIEFYKKKNITIEFDPSISKYLSGWGDGAINLDVENYLKFIDLENSEKSFDALMGKDGKFWFYCGAVPGVETFAAFNQSFKLIYFKNDSPEETGFADKFLDILEK